ncbi:MAG TPA: Uma2 family endonuclease [Pyrinomonadaceae bacterium]|jgi:Uma2 family endonuclease|nr:Uma2 family endonuclease [Pyrinomonadaceae bacterium]
MSVEIARHSFTVDEFERMGAAGIFHPDDRLELIDGEIVEMSPIGSSHAACVDALALLFNETARRRFLVRIQSPIRLDDFSEPQPDVALLRWRDDFYRHAHPTPADVLLVVEVADTTVESDRQVKIPLYARAGIPEVWLVNIPGERIEVYSAPEGETYRQVRRFGRGRRARSQTLEGFGVGVGEVLG